MQWANTLDVGPDDLADAIRVLLREASRLDDAILRLRIAFHGCPDLELEEGLVRLERQMGRSVGQIEDLHAQVRKELQS
ncbi:hypothetical protein GCM10022415_16050 [Knoellia locipacati]|uniref:Uncharacterized protein n=1 Tax=Knoellia locipacati TaxID=882824 RepID=A0A512SZZ8_9MICO|nr:hypothetical protein [Knoellia locipacati]GEQ13555.1 hypothetical protein KLO01_16020 [Knoellia locipacati]